jgi:hypothetical protein
VLAEDLEQVCCDEVFLGQLASRVEHEIVQLLWVTTIDVLKLVTPCR